MPKVKEFLDNSQISNTIQGGLPRRDTLSGTYHGGTNMEGIMGLGHLPKHLATPCTDSVLVSLLHDM